MGFRVYDKRKKKFIQDNIYLTPDGELVESKRALFGNKLSFVDQNRFVYQRYTELNDKDNTPIYVGDYLEAIVADDRVITGLVTFTEELGSYVILCFDSDEYFVLGQSVMQYTKIVGNVFDDLKGKKNGEETNQSL